MRFYTHDTTITDRPQRELIATGSSQIHGETKEDLLATRVKPRLERPSFYRVVLLNDDFTPMEFVVKVLENIFHKDGNEAVRIMLEVHTKGAGTCGVFTRDVAETKVDQTLYLARQHEHPLQCVIEKE